MIKKIAAGFLLVSASFLATAGPMSNQDLMQKFSAEKQKCMSIQKQTLRQECLVELRLEISRSLNERQHKVGEVIAGRESFKSAVKNREKIYEEAKHKDPKW
jgi:hypothetical protein